MENCQKVSKEPQSIDPADENDKVYNPYNIKKRMFIPYHIVADFKSVLEPIKEKKGKGEKFQHHLPVSYRFCRVRYDGMSGLLREFAGENASKHFIMAMIHEYFQIRDIYIKSKPMIPLNNKEK